MREVILKQAELAELSTEVLKVGGLFCFKAHGSSMYPFIQDGDILTIQPIKTTGLCVGDIAFYRADWDRLVTHRVVGKRIQDSRLVLVIRGNVPSCHDEIVQAAQILGRVMSVQRGDKIIRLDQRRWQLVSILWVRFSSLCHMLYRLARRTKRIALGYLNRV